MQKIIVVGLDCVTFKMLAPWIKQGKLPNLQRLMKEGVHGVLKSTLPPATPTAWTSFFTGTNPGKHNLLGFTNINQDYQMELYSAEDLKAITIWDMLGKAGKKTALINLPMTYPPKKIKGVMITGIETPSEFSDYTYPKELKQKLRKIVGSKYIIHPLPYRPDNEEEFIRNLHVPLKMRFRLIDYYLKKKFDLIVSVVAGTDKISDSLWKYIDKTHPLYDKKRVKNGWVKS